MSPAIPCSLKRFDQRHSVPTSTEKAAATAPGLAVVVRTSWTAANRRAPSSPASHA
jgi:hypothetical protein